MSSEWEGTTVPGFRRGIDVASTSIDDDGNPVLSVICDCGAAADITFEDMAKVSSGLEFAYTCDGCGTSHWMTVVRTGADHAG